MNRNLLVVFFLVLLVLSCSYVAKANQIQSELTATTRDIIVLKKNQPFANQLIHKNCIYIIRDEFDLKESNSGDSVTIPDNCVLKFEGGSIVNGVVSFRDTFLEGTIQLGVNCKGTIVNKEGSLSWFLGGSINSNNLAWLLKNCYKTDIDNDITLDTPIYIGSHKIELFSSNNSVLRVNCSPASFGNNTNYSWILSSGSASICIHDIIVDFDNKQYPLQKGGNNVYVGEAFRIVGPKMCSIYNVHVRNYGKTKGALKYDSFCAIAIHPNGQSVVNVHDLLFDNIIVVGDGDTGATQRGMGECLRVYYNNPGTQITSPVMIYNISCVNCYSVNISGKPISDDFDCIHIDALDSNNRLTLCKVSNCYFEGINKRAIKAQATNVHIDGVVYKNPNRIEGLSILINPFGEKCVIENVYAFPNTNGSIINTRFSPEVTVNNCIITADPNYSYTSLTGIVDCRWITNCVIKNVTKAIVGFNNEIGIGDITKKYWGEDFQTLKYATNVVDNCRFENCGQVYIRRNSKQDRLKCKFINCTFYNSSYISVENETELIGCRVFTDKSTEYELFTLIGKDYAKGEVLNKFIMKNCVIEISNNSKPLIMDRGSHYLRRMVFDIDNSSISTNATGAHLFSRNTQQDGDSQIVFDDFTIKNSRIFNYTLLIHKGWSGKFSIVNSILPIETGFFTRECSFYDATLKKGDTKIHFDGVKVLPDYNCLPLSSPAISGMPAVGTLYWQQGKPTWSNGTSWVDSNGAIVE